MLAKALKNHDNFLEFKSAVEENISYLKDQLNKTNEISIENKNGFYRIFSEDFPIGGDFEILLLDESVPSSLKDNYQVFFNGGSLHIAGLFYNNPTVGDPTAGFVPSQNQFYYRSSLPSNTPFYGGLTFFLN